MEAERKVMLFVLKILVLEDELGYFGGYEPMAFVYDLSFVFFPLHTYYLNSFFFLFDFWIFWGAINFSWKVSDSMSYLRFQWKYDQ